MTDWGARWRRAGRNGACQVVQEASNALAECMTGRAEAFNTPANRPNGVMNDVWRMTTAAYVLTSYDTDFKYVANAELLYHQAAVQHLVHHWGLQSELDLLGHCGRVRDWVESGSDDVDPATEFSEGFGSNVEVPQDLVTLRAFCVLLWARNAVLDADARRPQQWVFSDADLLFLRACIPTTVACDDALLHLLFSDAPATRSFEYCFRDAVLLPEHPDRLDGEVHNIGSLPVGTTVTERVSPSAPNVHTFEGYGMRGELLFSSASGASSATVSPSVALLRWDRRMVVNPADSSSIRFEPIRTPMALRVLKALLDITKRRMIQGARVLDLMCHLHAAAPGGVPVFIVGGAVRDVIDGESDISDIDLAVARPWNELVKDITGFFARRGVAMTDANFVRKGKHAKYGMMKIEFANSDAEKPETKFAETMFADNDAEKPEKPEAIDIGVFKSGRVERLPAAVQETLRAVDEKPEYYFGFSFERDAGMRDYSINAVYADLFGWQLVDPREGLSCVRTEGRPHHLLCFVPPNHPEFIPDLGGRVRLFKGLMSRVKDTNGWKYDVDQEHAGPICARLVAEARWFFNNLPEQSLAVGEPLPSMPDLGKTVEDWLVKVTTKLIKAEDDPHERLTLLRRVIDFRLADRAQGDAIEWFNITADLCQLGVDAFIFRELTGDSLDAVRLMQALEGWAYFSRATRARFTEAMELWTATAESLAAASAGCSSS